MSNYCILTVFKCQIMIVSLILPKKEEIIEIAELSMKKNKIFYND